MATAEQQCYREYSQPHGGSAVHSYTIVMLGDVRLAEARVTFFLNNTDRYMFDPKADG